MRVRGYIKTLGKFIAALIVGGGLVITWEPVPAFAISWADYQNFHSGLNQFLVAIRNFDRQA